MSIWFDVTTILHWDRPAVGVVRVETECARYFLSRAHEDIRFCRFDRGSGRYAEVSRKQVEENLARLQRRRDAARPASAGANADATREARLKAALFGVIDRLPSGPREAVLRFVVSRREAIHAALRALREARHALKKLARPGDGGWSAPPTAGLPPRADSAPRIFEAGDVYVSMGLDWDLKDLTCLYQLKQELGLKIVLFCYDIIPVKFPHLCVGDVASAFSKYFTDVAWCANQVLCISECSRRDLEQLLRELGAPVPALAVVPLGSDVHEPSASDDGIDTAALTGGKRFILFVSTIERRKNHETLYRAYCRLLENGAHDLPLMVFVGMPGWGVGDLLSDLRLDPRIQDYVRILNHVSDADLAQLYRQAEFTVYPSMYEGWGLPVAESLRFGKFCLASNAASIPEVGLDLIEYLDPWDVVAWAERIEWYARHPELLREKEQRIASEYRPVGWEHTGQVVLSAAQMLAAGEAGLAARERRMLSG